MCTKHARYIRPKKIHFVLMKQILSFLLFATISFNIYCQTQRDSVLSEMKRRPSDLWSRGKGHVVLGIPGSLEVEKAYLEPGGSFSPSFSSFGISIWSCDPDYNTIFTSDNINLNDIEQIFLKTTSPAIQTKTPYYECTHKINATYDSEVEIKCKKEKSRKTFIVIRSVGPSGAPIRKISLHGTKLIINDLWQVTISPAPAFVALGEETKESWAKTINSTISCYSKDGWAFARIELKDTLNRVHISREGEKYSSQLKYENIFSTLKIELPDVQFERSLNAQVAHLMMSLVKDECRPGEPNNYPLPWLRDGAYILTSLARSGQVETAKRLALYFATHDFFGGFGPEADAPGLAIWGIMQVAYEANDTAFYNEIWPHIRRKVELIHNMQYTKEPVRVPISGIVLKTTRQHPDSNLVCDASRDGLIIGRMDFHRPVTFINSVSYSGYRHASILADKLKMPEAALWKKYAVDIQTNWIKSFDSEWNNDRTFICSMWPDWIAWPIKEDFTEKATIFWNSHIDQDNNFKKTPLWTYFNFSEAHQWLFLQKPEKTWAVLEYFWKHQCSPGLYTWWEGNGEENSSDSWKNSRGWVKPENVTPHYWTAAEALGLQLDMLAFIRDSSGEPVLVIGEGVKKEWLNKPMKVENIRISGNIINWSWDLSKLTVQIKGSVMKVVPGSTFPSNTKIQVDYLKK